MRSPTRFGLALVFAALSIPGLPVQADFCARLPDWAEAPCRGFELAFGWPGLGASFGGPWFEKEPATDSFGADPHGRSSAASAEPPAEETQVVEEPVPPNG